MDDYDEMSYKLDASLLVHLLGPEYLEIFKDKADEEEYCSCLKCQ